MNNEDAAHKLWSPPQDFVDQSNIKTFIIWLEKAKGLKFGGYQELWEWSTTDIKSFWKAIWEYFEIIGSEYKSVLSGEKMPFYKWFEGSELNYSEHIFRKANDKYPALIYKTEDEPLKILSWQELKNKVIAIQKQLKAWDIRPGDRVAAYITNSAEATISFLAVNSLGAIWSSCSPDFGLSSVIDRFEQISPKVLIAVNGYRYGGKSFDKFNTVLQMQKALSSLEHTLLIPALDNEEISPDLVNTISWNDIDISVKDELHFTRVPFDHPIWILYSSGTTGIPKAITHSHGGILLEHLKYLTFHQNVKPGDRCFWYTTTGWMMWNYIQSTLLCGGTVVLYDGSPAWPKIDALWQFAEEARITHLGTSAGYIVANMKENKRPSTDYDLSALISIGSTGSPLPPEGFDWIYDNVKKDLWLTSISGGTDVCSAFVGGNPIWPVYKGEIQCRALGCKLEAYNDNGHPVIDEVGEMVITGPMPSMPIYFWNDVDYERYLSSYFDMFPNVWRHGDWIKITPGKGLIIYGRSDATLNRGGIRIGTSEIYRAVDKVTEVKDSLILCLEKAGGEYYMPLFIEMQAGIKLTDEIKKKIRTTIREEYTPRHVPDEIIEIEQVPYTISGKKTEAPVKKVLMGKDINSVFNKDALKNPEAMDFFLNMAKKLNV